jgi:antitoxin (DNA-binding transcriptional repressor) of toxin-antitoxin stability system
LIEKAINGEEVIIAKAGEPMVRLVSVRKKEDWWGSDEGKIWIADDFDTLPDDLMAAFHGELEDEPDLISTTAENENTN